MTGVRDPEVEARRKAAKDSTRSIRKFLQILDPHPGAVEQEVEAELQWAEDLLALQELRDRFSP